MTNVAPCVGAWIEINTVPRRCTPRSVAPCVGAWIEISRVFDSRHKLLVAPCVGAWIEIRCGSFRCSIYLRRSLRGSVD